LNVIKKRSVTSRIQIDVERKEHSVW